MSSFMTKCSPEGLSRCPNEEWLTLAGERSWCVLMKDARIRYRPTERESLRAGGVHAFCLSRGNLAGPQAAGVFLRHEGYIRAAAARVGPSLHLLSQDRALGIEDIRIE